MMDLQVREKLIKINYDFYEGFAKSFSASRHQVQPGVQHLITDMIHTEAILDVGCGNGTLARALAAMNYQGEYLGVDMSQELLTKAEGLQDSSSVGDFKFMVVNLVDSDWHQALPGMSFDWLSCFAVLHHIPGEEFRSQIVRNFASLVLPGGIVAISVWQWQNSPRLRKRVQPWSRVGLGQDDLEEGDVLLDWRAGETIGLRYVHTYSEEELSALAESAGFKVIKNYYSDGKVRNLAYYQIWQMPN
jgi:SAM-dependent methyltransferase